MKPSWDDVPQRKPHAKLRRVSATVTTLRRGARNTANHRIGRYPPYQWFSRVGALCAPKGGGRDPGRIVSVVSAFPREQRSVVVALYHQTLPRVALATAVAAVPTVALDRSDATTEGVLVRNALGCFFTGEFSTLCRSWLRPLVAARFPRLRRTIFLHLCSRLPMPRARPPGAHIRELGLRSQGSLSVQ